MKDTIEILKDLVAIPSYVDAKVNEASVADYICDLFVGSDYKVVEQIVEGKRRNLIISNAAEPKLVLFGHMDTVPPKGEDKSVFELRSDGSKLYGLGTVDMKSGLAVMINAALRNKKEGLALVMTVDEEYEFKGARKLLEGVRMDPDLIVNLEPTSGRIVNGCRGITEFSMEVRGKSAHAGRKQLGVNAIEKAVELVRLLEIRVKEGDLPDGGRSSVNLAGIKGGLYRGIDANGEPEFGQIGNQVPDYAWVNCEIRLANQITEDWLVKKIKEIAISLSVVVENIRFKFLLGSMYTDKTQLIAVNEVLEKAGIKVKYADVTESGYYEVQMLQEKWGSKVVVFGVSPIEKCHMQDEYVDKESIYAVEKVVDDLIERLLR